MSYYCSTVSCYSFTPFIQFSSISVFIGDPGSKKDGAKLATRSIPQGCCPGQPTVETKPHPSPSLGLEPQRQQVPTYRSAWRLALKPAHSKPYLTSNSTVRSMCPLFLWDNVLRNAPWAARVTHLLQVSPARGGGNGRTLTPVHSGKESKQRALSFACEIQGRERAPPVSTSACAFERMGPSK